MCESEIDYCWLLEIDEKTQGQDVGEVRIKVDDQ